MKFRAHESFFIRKGWLYKGLKNVRKKPNVFTDTKTQNPMDTLGLGANMVKSLRYWMQAVCLTTEPTSRIRAQSLTPLGEIIWENDRYIEEIGTLWLLHYKLATNDALATAWYYFFNVFRMSEFKKEDFLLSINNYIKIELNEEIALSSLESDFDCIMNTYISKQKSSPERLQPESNIDSPFGELGLIDLVNKRERLYRKCAPMPDSLHPLILLAVILDNAAENQRQIKMTTLQNDRGNIGRVFHLDTVILIDSLYKLAALGHIEVIRTAGLDVINIKTEMTFEDCVRRYYAQINQ